MLLQSCHRELPVELAFFAALRCTIAFHDLCRELVGRFELVRIKVQEESPDLFRVGLMELDSHVHSTGSDQCLVQSVDVVCRENKNLSVPVGYPIQSIQEAAEGQRAFFGLLVSVGVEQGVDIFDDDNGVLGSGLKAELNRVVIEVRIGRLEEAEVASEMAC